MADGPAFDLAVIGLGAMGLSALRHAAGLGLSAIGFEMNGVPNAAGSSHGVTRGYRVAYNNGAFYVPLVQEALAEWRALERETGTDIVVRTGGLDIGPRGSTIVEEAERSCREHGLAFERLDGVAAGRRFDGLALPPGFEAVYQPESGLLRLEPALYGLARAAVQRGARILGHEPVLALGPDGAGVTVETRTLRCRARRAVVATGPWIARLVPGLGALAVPERQVIAWVRPVRGDAYTAQRFPTIVMDDGRYKYYMHPELDMPGLKVARRHHRGQAVADPDGLDRSVDAEDRAIVEDIVDRFFPLASGDVIRFATCIFTNTPDQHFILDLCPGTDAVSFVSACSGHGFKFAPVLGRLAVELALEGRPAGPRDPFRLSRFAPTAVSTGA